MNDGWYITYQLGCDSNGTYCKNSGCYDDIGKSTKICCCNNSDNCVDKDASSPVVYDLTGITVSSATAAYQVEGGAFEDGRGASIWDIYVRKPNVIKNNDTGDDACKSYDYWQKDIVLLKALGIKAYRFSISWTRIFTDGTPATKNDKGIAYYDNLIDVLINAGIEPVVTMYHWDLPQWLMDNGGWLNRETYMAFGDYCEFLFKQYGDRVKKWIPLNEPSSVIEFEYCGDTHADAEGDFKPHCAWTLYLAARNLLLGHAEAWKRYQKFNGTAQGGGQLGIALNGPWYFPGNPDDPNDQDASVRAYDFGWGIFAEPLFGSGNWPESVFNRIQELSTQENRSIPRLAIFTNDEQKLLKGSAQFFGVNYYVAAMVKDIRDDLKQNRWSYNQEDYDSGTTSWIRDSWIQTNASNGWIYYTPSGLRALLNHINANYKDIPIIITENGCMDSFNEDLEDVTRVHYLRGHLMASSQAKNVDNVNVIGHTVWSLMDNFEWLDGYTTKFGIHQVDFNDPERKRTPKRSAKELTNWVSDGKVPGFSPNSRY
ncbi:hypothetical protein FO519_009372 [Halicephalobus sp. NKZ332]|nr:hypothetical protein FO519_009372 [Halicephalobus sp. NKZ332]